jgi:dTDP-4-amino-4,6-dideoxygalactose transaminase
MPIKLFDVTLENSWIKDEFFNQLSSLYDAANFTLGFGEGPVEELEKIFAEHSRRSYALGVTSGTAALHMAAFALGLKPGDEVIVPANTFISTALAPAMLGATIVECDVDPDTLNISSDTVSKVISPKTKAIFAVNLYGNPAPYTDLKTFHVPVLEDAAHSHGSVYRALPSGKFGDISIFSFFPTKVFGGIGDSGLILFDKEEWLAPLKAFRNCGQEKSHYAVLPGNVYRMHVVQALFLKTKWKIFDKIISHRRKIAKIYDDHFKGTDVRPQKITPCGVGSYFAYVVRLPHRDKVGEKLSSQGVPWTIQYRYLLHQQPVWEKIPHVSSPVPHAEKALSEIISLPMNTSVTEDQAAFVAKKVLESL